MRFRDAHDRALRQPAPAAGGAIQQAFTVVGVRFVGLDPRSQRSPATQPDDASKTMLGARQKAWLKRELLAARDRSALTVLVNFRCFTRARSTVAGASKDGPYSEGAFPGAGQFGTVHVCHGGDRVDVVLTGRDYTSDILVHHRFGLAVRAQ